MIMAKRKQQNENVEKLEQENTLTNEQNTANINEKSSTTSKLAYHGSVKVTIKKGNKIISSKNYHNKGNTPLFHFLSNCLAGNYQEADRPKYAIVFYNSAQYNSDSNNDINTNSNACSIPIIINKVGLVSGSSSGSTLENRNGVVLHFTIPGAFIDATDYQNKINQLGLYSQKYSASESYTNYSACWNFIDDSNPPKWDDLEISTINEDYNIFIEWTMSFSDESNNI